MTANKAVIEESHDEKGTCVRTVRLTPEGALRLEGHDLGPFVKQFFGYSEYEFVRRVSPSGVDQLRRALGLDADDDLITALADQFQGPGASNRLEKLLETEGIESEFWNRIGD